MKIQLIKIPRKMNFVVLGVLFMFSSVLLAREGKSTLSSSAKIKQQNQQIVVTGKITSSDDKKPIPGVNVTVKGNPAIGVVTDINGDYKITLPSSNETLIFSSVGMQTIEKKIDGQTEVNIVMSSDQTTLQEVIIVGFGQQKKESVVGAISQVSGKVLQRTGGVTSLGAALTGNLPGVTTLTTTGKPGEEDPEIIIRGVSSWNNSQPLILVDGIERAINSVDITSVETVSVLKDASATAVYGVRGANGVVLITTKRGVVGKAKIDFGYSAIMKAVSKLPGKMDAYDALMVKNKVIEYELNQQPVSWTYMRPQSFIDNYRNQTTQEQRERYPNIDWQDYLFKDTAMSHTANVNISGGTDRVKYYAAVDYANEGDLVKVPPSNQGFESGYSYNRINSRANLDFQLTKSTVFKVNLSGSYGLKKAPWRVISEGYMWAGAYNTPPDLYYPLYSDGSWGYYPQNSVQGANSALNLAIGGSQSITTTRIATDFNLRQDLGKILKGLSANVTFSLDNTFLEEQRGINNDSYSIQSKYIDPVTGIPVFSQTPDVTTNFDFYEPLNWATRGGTMNDGSTYRNLNYQAQINYVRDFGVHNVTGMGNFQRQETASGANIPAYREDWVFRATYGYNKKYFLDYNGAYNGTEKFAPDNRFGFFSSGAVGWMITEEKFMKKLTFLDQLKLRYSYGQVGDDSYNGRWLYEDVYGSSISRPLLTQGNQGELSNAYGWITQTSIGNPSIAWEKVTKQNLGLDFSLFKKVLSGSVDVFKDYRTNIILNGSQRAVPSYFGFAPPVVNKGIVEVKGFEFELHYSQRLTNDLRLWSDVSFTQAKDEVIDRDDPALLPEYVKREGYPNRQSTSMLDQGFYNTWDELYGSTAFDSNDAKIPGNYRIMDFNGDGVIDNNGDRVRYGYPSNPQNTYNASLGVDWKGFSAMVQFYGVSNVSRYIETQSFGLPYFNTVYDEGTYWSKDNTNADSPMPRLNSTLNGNNLGTRYLYDGSYIRLKNAEIAYTFNSEQVKRIGLESLRIYANGNNLWLWTRTPDDREVNGNTAYPSVSRISLGFRLTL
ncbi:SusC/RagA family TonB-linked outer membrane protein [Flavobacterium eburneipallidum]|uniref:SusC/RagA family TonB-linked outer membrane protein n=1 Tax=Flavobacterium eburneipallidum TaxID=3003263 RepID=UPI002482B157|nr:TonB-dependent receptor [Flavobacterium eburneipallidum]